MIERTVGGACLLEATKCGRAVQAGAYERESTATRGESCTQDGALVAELSGLGKYSIRKL